VEYDLRELRVLTGKQTALERQIWKAVPVKAKDQSQKNMMKDNSLIYECLSHAHFLTFLGK
jgi:hypothetical protein